MPRNAQPTDQEATVRQRREASDRCLREIESDALLIGAAVTAMRRECEGSGCNTPAETLLKNLLFEYLYTDGAVPLEKVKGFVKEFESDFRHLIITAQAALRIFPGLEIESDIEHLVNGEGKNHDA